MTLVVVLNAGGNVLLSVGMKQVGAVHLGSVSAVMATAAATFASPLVWLGVASLILFFVCYLLLLSWADYSFVTPVTAIGYVVVPLLGWSLLGEHVSALRWAGIALICVGVALVSGTPPRTTPPRER
jgi:drug/metabolite transporter (DMT)-like permease